jgi:hypothetical protein
MAVILFPVLLFQFHFRSFLQAPVNDVAVTARRGMAYQPELHYWYSALTNHSACVHYPNTAIGERGPRGLAERRGMYIVLNYHFDYGSTARRAALSAREIPA